MRRDAKSKAVVMAAAWAIEEARLEAVAKAEAEVKAAEEKAAAEKAKADAEVLKAQEAAKDAAQVPVPANPDAVEGILKNFNLEFPKP